jgi:hypothetical protein
MLRHIQECCELVNKNVLVEHLSAISLESVEAQLEKKIELMCLFVFFIIFCKG